MNKRKLLALVLTGVMAISTLAGCGSSDTKTSDTDVKTSETAETSDKNVLRVGMECAYAPFNWTQDSDTTPWAFINICLTMEIRTAARSSLG